jgi:hypothetical protein
MTPGKDWSGVAKISQMKPAHRAYFGAADRKKFRTYRSFWRGARKLV